MPPAARLTDMHACPMVTPGLPPIPHVGGPIIGPGVPNVLICYLAKERIQPQKAEYMITYSGYMQVLELTRKKD